MAVEKDWNFIGRALELQQIQTILARKRWFFVKISGRRRIGKTTLVQEAMGQREKQVFYVQIPDSDEVGVLTAIEDAWDVFNVDLEAYPQPRSLSQWATTVEAMIQDGYLIVIDEFQYFNRPGLMPFCSTLQAVVDRLSAKASEVHGGLIVLGSLHAEMMALLEDRSAPLYNRVTDSIDLSHLDIHSLLEILDRYTADASPERLLMLWTLFEGVPKYYRDAFEQNVLDEDRETLIRRLFFESSSPLRNEANTWFLSELKGRNDMILKYIARHPGLNKRELESQISDATLSDAGNIGSYLSTLVDKYRLVDRKQPIFAKPNARKGRYYIADNFLQSWLAALESRVGARQFRPVDKLVSDASDRLQGCEGFGLEKLVATIYEERSRQGMPGFEMTEQISGYWDRAGTEIDFVACNSETQTLRIATCKRAGGKLVADIPNFLEHVDRFLEQLPKYKDWKIERYAIAPRLSPKQKQSIERYSVTPQDLDELTGDMRPTSRQQRF